MNTNLQYRINRWLNNTSEELDISSLNLNKWPDALKGKENLIIKLNCYNNQLKSIPSLPNLTYLICFCNKLGSLPSLPELTYLFCIGNQLESLPSLPKLITLLCSDNHLFSNSLEDWKKIWPLQHTYITTLQNAGINRLIKTLKLRLYLPRLDQLHQELVFSPYHPGKFYKKRRLGKWSK